MQEQFAAGVAAGVAASGAASGAMLLLLPGSGRPTIIKKELLL